MIEFFKNLWNDVSTFFVDLWNFNQVAIYIMGGLVVLFLLFFIICLCVAGKKRKLKKKLKAVEAAKAEIISDRAAASQSNQNLISSKEKEITSLKTLNEESKQTIESLENDLKEKIDEVNNLKTKTVELEDAKVAVEGKLAEAEEKISEAETLISNKDLAILDEKNSYGALLESKNALEADYNELLKNNSNLKEKIDDLKALNTKIIGEKDETNLENRVLLKAMGIIYNDALDDKKIALTRKMKKSEVKETVEKAATEVLNRKELYEQAKKAGIKNYILMTNEKIASEIKKAEENK